MKKHCPLVVAILSALCTMNLSSWTCASAQDIDGVLALTPVEEHSCIAVQLDVGQGQPIQGLTWYHNDSQVLFPRLLLMEGQEGVAPDLSQTALVLADLSGSSLSWGEVTLEAPVSSSTGYIDAVFEFPAWTERTGTGNGGGPGIGYGSREGPEHAWVTRDGAEWLPLHSEYRVAVSPVVSAARAASTPRSLAELAEYAPEGWWQHVEPTDIAKPSGPTESESSASPLVSRERPVLAVPNPFNPRTEVSFYVESGGMVTVDVFDVRGRRVTRLLQERLQPGARSVFWEGTDHAGSRVASGVYFVSVRTASGAFEQRVALVR